jgi:glutamine---fructose-6-phosphate transaminase (isomerizing)
MGMLDEMRAIPTTFENMIQYYRSGEGYKQLKNIQTQFCSPSYRMIQFIGMGTSLFGAIPSVYILNAHSHLAHTYEAGEWIHHLHSSLSPNDLVILISQSGVSAEILLIANRLQAHPPTLAVTNDLTSPLGTSFPHCLALNAGQEEGPSTKTYIHTLALNYLLTQMCLGKAIHEILDMLSTCSNAIYELQQQDTVLLDQMEPFLSYPDFLNTISRGPSIASQNAAALLLKETARIYAEPLSGAAFRHGPMEVIQRDSYRAIMFVSDPSSVTLLNELALAITHYKHPVLYISAFPPTETQPNLIHITLPQLDPYLMPLLEIIPIQFLAYYYAKNQGYTPGEFLVGSKVTTHE